MQAGIIVSGGSEVAVVAVSGGVCAPSRFRCMLGGIAICELKLKEHAQHQ